MSVQLSKLDIELLRMLSKGWTRKEVAYARQRSAKTISNQLRWVYAKLGATNLIEALVTIGWLKVPEE